MLNKDYYILHSMLETITRSPEYAEGRRSKPDGTIPNNKELPFSGERRQFLFKTIDDGINST